MRVTPEMVERFVERMCATRAFGTLSDSEVRECLNAALADAPEPSYYITGGFDEQAGRYHAEARAEAAEAKLEKVRAWRKHYALTAEAGDELDAILYGEDP